MRLPISKEKGPIGRKCEHWPSFIGTRNSLANARENPFHGGYGLSLSVQDYYFIATFILNSYFPI